MSAGQLTLLEQYRVASSSDLQSVLNVIVNAPPFTFDTNSRSELIGLLLKDIKSSRILPRDNTLALLTLKTLSKTAAGSETLGTATNLSALLEIAFSLQEEVAASGEALRCIGNALLVEPARAMFLSKEVNGPDTCVHLLSKVTNAEQISILARILHLSTAHPSPFIVSLVEGDQQSHPFVDMVRGKLDLLVISLLSGMKMAREAMVDVLKFASNVIIHYPKLAGAPVVGETWNPKLDLILPPILRVFHTLPPTFPAPISPPLTQVLQALINIPVNPALRSEWYGGSMELTGSSSQQSVPTPSTLKARRNTFSGSSWTQTPVRSPQDTLLRAHDLLEKALAHYFPDVTQADDIAVQGKVKAEGILDSLDDELSPLIVLIIRLCQADETSRSRTREWLIPANLDRSAAAGTLEMRSDLLGRCLRLMSSVHFTRLKETIGEMLFVVCDSDSSVMQASLGHRNVVGFLSKKGIGDTDVEAKEEYDVGDGAGIGPAGASSNGKKVRRKWSPEETQMLVDGCNIHGVGNWKAILSDPNLTFSSRSPVDLKDRFRTYFPEAYRTHYPNARTHLPPSIARARARSTSPSALASSSSLDPISPTKAKANRSTHPDGTPLFPLPTPSHPRRRPFTQEEDNALLAGFRKHGAAWAVIAKDAPVFAVTGRRSMDLRDRFRNAWPGEYERAGYKARPRAARKKDNADAVVKDDETQPPERGRGRIGRSHTDDGPVPPRIAALSAGPSASAGGGPVRRRQRAHTSQGFQTTSMPASAATSDDEGVMGNAHLMSFGRGGEFGFSFAMPATEESALVGGMHKLDVASPANASEQDEAMPDVTPSPLSSPPSLSSPAAGLAPSKLQAQILHQQQVHNLGAMQQPGETIGRSAWGTQDWLSANPRLDPSYGTGTFRSPFSPWDTSDTTGDASGPFFDVSHSVLERYDLAPAHHVHHHHHHSPGQSAASTPHGFSSPALSFHSASLSLSDVHTSSETGTVDGDWDSVFDEQLSNTGEYESEPGGGTSSWGGGFRGFTHHVNTAGDLIFGARTHQPPWSGFDLWTRPGGLAGIAEAPRGGKLEEDTGPDPAEEDKVGLFPLDDLVDLPNDPPDSEMDGNAVDSFEPPGTPQTQTRTVHIHHHHHHHHHYANAAAAARSTSVPPDLPPTGLDPTLLANQNLPFLDLHYNAAGPASTFQQMHLEGWQALDLARASSSSGISPAVFSLPVAPLAPPPATSALYKQAPPRPLMRSVSGSGHAHGMNQPVTSTSINPATRHQRRQSAASVRPQDVLLQPVAPGASLKGKRKRASWDGGAW